MIQWALRNGAHPDGVYYDGQSYQASAVVPFDEAIRTPGVAGVEIAQALVNGGANVSNVIVERPGASGGMKFGLHGSPMIHALKAHRFDIANVMMTSSTFNPRATGSNGVNDTILLQAGKVGHLATVNQLVKNGALEGATANDYLNLIKGTSKGLIESSTSSGRSLYTSATEGDPASIERCNEFSAIHKLFVGKLTELYPQELEKMYGMTRSGQRRIRTEFSMCEMRVVPEAVSAAPPARPGEKPPLAQCTL